MLLDFCNPFSSGCVIDWNAVSAIATVAATATALFLPGRQRSRDQRERKEALAYSLFLKLIKIHSDLFKLKEHVLEQRQLAIDHGATPDTWGFFRPLATLPNEVSFSSEELAVLFSLKEDDTFNTVLSMDEIHRSDLALMRLYSEKRELLTQLLPAGGMEGAVGSVNLDSQTFVRLAPSSVQLEMLVASIAASILTHSSEAEKALLALHKALNEKLKMKLGLSMPGQQANQLA